MIDWDIFANPAPLINMASRSFAKLGERRVKALGFSIGQMPVLYLLRDGGAMSQKELAQFAKIEQPSMAQMLARMERDGLIKRTPDPNDGRSSLISLTEEALVKLPAVREALQKGRKETFADFSVDEISTMVSLLQRLNKRLDQLVEHDEAD
ncbi:MarR family transcriptional regulator (plasmid) [Phyllobacterium sp. 628]|uniref:MarR family winged helix-turn-helix transcriptional regulator n=1 Tax=Phyllobacterium sp. 628 TaxID=2718938 RepID=UPI0016626765|nr:MarR family transcriptional regulator [Phyllobacterium sp. 628]QND54385.1 MarR family transcriptional regulator [Phyllobacterium sp. 628]